MHIRQANLEDLNQIVQLLIDDDLGKTRETYTDNLSESYVGAFKSIDKDKNNFLFIGEVDLKVMACLQLTFIPNLTFEGGLRAQIEGVRVSKDFKGKGFGSKLIEFAINRAKEKKCKLVQLTTNKKRGEAIKFYENLNFKATHEGMKLYL